MSIDRCARCGEEGPDKRTLLMECFYDMGELNVPFAKKLFFELDSLKHTKRHSDPAVIELRNGTKIAIQAGTITTTDPLRPWCFYALTVCKSCRADWMRAIEDWFGRVSGPVRTGTGAFIRERGATREMTEEEVAAMEAEGRTVFRVKTGKETP